MTEKQEETLRDLALDYGLVRTEWVKSNGEILSDVWEALRDYVQELIDEAESETENRWQGIIERNSFYD